MKKLVEREHIKHIINEIHEIRDYVPCHLKNRLSELEIFIDNNVYNNSKETKNEFKRAIYKRMKNAATPAENKVWYEFYKTVDELEFY